MTGTMDVFYGRKESKDEDKTRKTEDAYGNRNVGPIRIFEQREGRALSFLTAKERRCRVLG
jgi:hypothetical protein